METDLLVPIIGVSVGFLGFLFGLYKHFSTRKVARLTYDATQLADFDIPPSFIQDLARAPVAILVESTGSKAAENVVLQFKAASEIDHCEVEPGEYVHTAADSRILVKIDKLNPGQKFRVFAYCKGSALVNQIEEIELSHAEGKGVDRESSAFTRIIFSMWFVALEFDLLSRSLRVTRLGPWKIV